MTSNLNKRSFFQSYIPQILWVSLLVAVFYIPSTAEAHVKWFSEFSFADKPKTPGEILNPLFLVFFALATVVIILVTLIEEKLNKFPVIANVDKWFAERSSAMIYVMRIGVAITLLWSWQSGTVLAPDLSTDWEWMIWLQFLVAALLIFDSTIVWAGIGILVLYAVGIVEFGFFHMLDYLLFLGVAWFFAAYQSKSDKIQPTALPALYTSLGFCLIWLGIEKLVYPSWTSILFQENPVLTMGIKPDLFVGMTALIEICLGFMIMMRLQERLLALVITLVFMMTTMVFGRDELVGHTLIHTVLIAFLLAGPGQTTPPLHWVSNMKLRLPFTALAFALVFAALMIPYSYAASLLHDFSAKLSQNQHKELIEVASETEAPQIAVSLHKDPMKGWNLELIKDNFTFSPSAAGQKHVKGEGHAVLQIDGKEVARLYSDWYHIPELSAGKHHILVTLCGNSFNGLSLNGELIQAAKEVNVTTP